ncbi:MAG: hypothetical protein ABH829_02095 [archaeon]
METANELYSEICDVLREAYAHPLTLTNPKTGKAERVRLEQYYPNRGEIKIIKSRNMMDQLRLSLYLKKMKIGGRRSSWEAFKEWMMTSSRRPVEILIIPKEKISGSDIGDIYVLEEFLAAPESMMKAARITAGMYLFYVMWDVRKEIAEELLADKLKDGTGLIGKIETKLFGAKETHHGIFTAEEMLGISLYVLEHLSLHENVHELKTAVRLHKGLAAGKAKTALQSMGIKVT